MRKLKNLLWTFVLATILGSSFSCAWLASPPKIKIAVQLPPRPVIEDCWTPIDVGGKVVTMEGQGDVLVLPIDQAKQLREWISEGMICSLTNEEVLEGHIEKLENRLKALSNG